MADRSELMESALEASPEGIALISEGGQVLLWNRAAEAMSGFPGIEVVARRTPFELEPLLFPPTLSEPDAVSRQEHGTLLHFQHKLGHEIQVIARVRVLRNDLGERIGHAILFRPGDRRGQIAAAENSGDVEAASIREQLAQRMEESFAEFKQGGKAFGVVRISVDQAGALRSSHGTRAYDAMLDCVERTLSNTLHSSEEIGRWVDAEFLVLTEEPTADRLAARMQAFAGMARISVFRWWGDRISITVSAGAAFAEPEEDLVQLMERAQVAMTSSIHAGGNHTMMAPRRHLCSRS